MLVQKKYQIFISSTYLDLVQERRSVLGAILDLGHIPSGMELFSAADEEQFSYIKRIIDESDYYILVTGGRYGSIDQEGISYTEKEYDYAYGKSIPILAFLHENINTILMEMSSLRQKRWKSFDFSRRKYLSEGWSIFGLTKTRCRQRLLCL
jgi:Domain of unknown function (DUF4062)